MRLLNYLRAVPAELLNFYWTNIRDWNIDKNQPKGYHNDHPLANQWNLFFSRIEILDIAKYKDSYSFIYRNSTFPGKNVQLQGNAKIFMQEYESGEWNNISECQKIPKFSSMYMYLAGCKFLGRHVATEAFVGIFTVKLPKSTNRRAKISREKWYTKLRTKERFLEQNSWHNFYFLMWNKSRVPPHEKVRKAAEIEHFLYFKRLPGGLFWLREKYWREKMACEGTQSRFWEHQFQDQRPTFECHMQGVS